MPQEPMRAASELELAELRTIVGDIQEALWLDEYATDEQRSSGGSTSFWNADKQWGCADMLRAIATVLEDHGLKPIDPPNVIGTTHKLDYEDEPIPNNYGDSEDPEVWTPHARPTS